MPSHNSQLVRVLRETAALLEINGGNRFRVNAYERAARAIGELAEPLEPGVEVKPLTEIDGVGKGMAERIVEFMETGEIREHAELLEKFPPGLLPLLDIQGLGPKRVAQLYHEAGVDSLATLKQKLDSGELRGLPGMGDKTLDKMRQNIAFAESNAQRLRIGHAMPVAERMLAEVEAIEQVKQARIGGSLRRGQETIGDVDLLAAVEPDDAETVAKAFREADGVDEVLASGKAKTSIRTREGVQVDLRLIEPASFGAALIYFTGDKAHNVRLRERAIARDMRLNEYSLSQGDTIVARGSEEDVYQALDLAWIPPELRTDRNEIEWAEQDKLPQLLELDDIRCELHAHTTASDGHWSIDELADAALERGFHTVAVTDHSRSQYQAGGLDEDRLREHIRAVRDVARRRKSEIRILAGSEVDILADGSLDYGEDLLAELDLVVASPHAALTQETDQATDRLLRAIEHPRVHILGHATGRIINRRPGLQPDMNKLVRAAKAHHVAMEINANHFRLDLRDTHARLAIESGVKLAINTDAHGHADLGQLRYGVLTARRAGAGKADVINCLTEKQLEKWLDTKRG